MVNRNCIFLMLLLLLLAGCQLLNKPLDDSGLQGTWTLYDVTAENPGSVDVNVETQMKNGLEVGSIINFFSDSSFTKAEGNGDFAMGNWRMTETKNGVVLTTRHDGKNEIPFAIESPAIGQKAFALVMFKNGFLYRYKKTSAPLQDYRQDPFYKANNRWRMTPADSEDSTHLRERLANYFKHLALLLRASRERNETVVSFVYSQGPVRIYSGGIGILPFKQVKRCWKNGFFNDDDAEYAYTLYGNYLSESHNMGVGTGDWITDDYHILMTIYPAFHAGRKRAKL